MPKYNAKEVEGKWKKFWESEGIYKFDSKNLGTGKNVFSIDTPPPTVSGAMHIGHVFQYSQMDFVARFKRMQGFNVFYPFGTDDNGLPTERLVEKLNHVKSKKMSREDFINLCIKTLKKITPDFIQDWKDIGTSCDYDIIYSTIDDNSRRISQKSFVDLYNDGKAYKKEFPTLWCPECQTAIAQAELEDKEENSLFSTLKFKANGKDLLVATTRPELLGACVGVFVNPLDKRYKKLVGKKAKVPLFGFEVPIIADKSADMEKGTGVLMVCSYGDKFDVEAIEKHKLVPRIVIDSEGKLKEGNYNGLKIKEARGKILEDLKKAGLIKEQKDISHVVNTHDRCGTCIEFVQTEQWFIKVLDKKKELLAQGKKVNWMPSFMLKRYLNWVEGLEWDWNISRDRHFGIPIPVWECRKCNEIIVADEKELPIDPLQVEKKCPKCNGKAEPETKVLDTWQTSSVSPQIASSLVDGKIKLPFSLRSNAHDIIRTWDFYTIVKSYYHENKIPWKDLMISGFITLKGEKMSKSKGNVVAPQEIIENQGADSLRFWAAGSKLGEDLDYREEEILNGKKFVNKLWNAANFVFMNLKDYKGQKPKKFVRTDELFLRRLNLAVKKVTQGFEEYEYSKARAEVERFFWKEFADNYIEIVKKRVYNSKGDEKVSAQYTLYHSLLGILKMIAPIMPFVTEEIYQEHFRKLVGDKSIHISTWPKIEREEKSEDLDLFYELLAKIRQEKTKAQKSMNVEIVLTLEKKDKDKIKDMIEDFKGVVCAREIREGSFGVEFV